MQNSFRNVTGQHSSEGSQVFRTINRERHGQRHGDRFAARLDNTDTVRRRVDKYRPFMNKAAI